MTNLIKELKDTYDCIEKHDAVKYLCRNNTKDFTAVTVSEALEAYKLAY